MNFMYYNISNLYIFFNIQLHIYITIIFNINNCLINLFYNMICFSYIHISFYIYIFN